MGWKAQTNGCTQKIETGGIDGAGIRSAGWIKHILEISAQHSSRKRAVQRAGGAGGKSIINKELTRCLFVLRGLPFKRYVTHAKGKVTIEPRTQLRAITVIMCELE